MFDPVLVVGGAGFAGSHVVDTLVKAKVNKIVVIDNLFLGSVDNLKWAQENGNVIFYQEDARYITALDNIIDREKPQAVINLAVKCLPYGFIDPEGSFMTGVEIAYNLAALARKRRFQRLLHFSSSEAYGSARHRLMDETHPIKPTTPYGAGKAAADLLLLSYHKLFGCDISIIRPFNLYGPRQNMKAYAAVIPVTIHKILTGEFPILHGDGTQTRDFSYVKDVAKAAIKLLECDAAIGQIVNIGSGHETPILSLINMICDILLFPKENVIRASPRASDVRRLCADVSKAKKLIKYEPSGPADFEENLRETIEWYKKKGIVRF